MIYHGLDIGGNTGFTTYDLDKKSIVNECVIDTRLLNEEHAAEMIIDKILEVAVKYQNRKHVIISEQFIQSGTMRGEIFKYARVEAMIRFYFKSMGVNSKFEYITQVPQKRIPFIETTKAWIMFTGTTKCHLVDSFAHILARLYDDKIDVPVKIRKAKKERKKLEFEEYSGGVTF